VDAAVLRNRTMFEAMDATEEGTVLVRCRCAFAPRSIAPLTRARQHD
jgi:hypothetical protein